MTSDTLVSAIRRLETRMAGRSNRPMKTPKEEYVPKRRKSHRTEQRDKSRYEQQY